MKKLLVAIAMLAAFSTADAQTEGTNTLGLGINSQKQESEVNSQAGTERLTQTTRFFSLGYGHFVKENVRIGVDFSYGKSEVDFSQGGGGSNQNFYGGRLSYQKYYPLLKKFYAFAGARGGYDYSKSETDNSQNGFLSHTYSAGGYGGLTWFLSKRFAFETDLLSANVSYSKTENQNIDPITNNTFESNTTNFNLTTTGAINNLGFKIYFLF